ncbi:MAG: Ppx/GppA family phosphatase [Alphaproteobacteria bacterium]|jgi:exopolyphosphatase/guanosine-5'-triphosphate,3'-diphosphate pyrophosphatase|nr:Ppx/GppA family phosphatase [Alphaproteobacteria bacterium]
MTMQVDSEDPAAARFDPNASDRVAVLDVGSNSVRMVVYAPPARAPIPIFNEKVLCGLGRDFGRTGRLDPEGRTRALESLRRFARIAEAMSVRRVDAVATAAVREADDGAAFVAEARDSCGIDIRVLDGAEEARLSALGVLAGTPGAEGLMGDLGGGSLELVELTGRDSGQGVTLPLGSLRLSPLGDDAMPEIDAALGGVPWLDAHAGGNLFLVGGAWRALARIDARRLDYPLRVLHGYAVARRHLLDLATTVAGLGPASLERIKGVSRERLADLPAAARVLIRLLAACRPKRVVFSAYGLREGLLFERLSAAEKRQDPLLVACRAIARQNARFADQADALVAWTAPLFGDETTTAGRLREAAALLSDIGWQVHPDYRPEQAFLEVVRGPYVGLDHNERARLALMVRARYTGRAEDAQVRAVAALLSEAQALEARRVGQSLRLGLTISGGVPELLSATRLSIGRKRLRLHVRSEQAALAGLVVRKRLEALADTMGRDGEVVIGD